VPLAHSRIVFGPRRSFIYVEFCPLCGLEHVHGSWPLRGEGSDPLQGFDVCNGYRSSHCGTHGLGRIVKKIKGGGYITVERAPPPEYRELEGHSYRLVLGPNPACFTPLGIKSEDARWAMTQLAKRGVPTSGEILRPRRSFFLDYGG
jgi:hypothetical protein